MSRFTKIKCAINKKNSRILFSSLVVLPLSAFAQSQVIDFHQAVEFALNSNPVVFENSGKIKQAEAELKKQKGEGLPNVNLNVNTFESNNPLDVFSYKLSQGQVKISDFGFNQLSDFNSVLGEPLALNNPGYYNNVDTGLVINIPLYLGGASVNQIKEAKELIKRAKEGNKEAKLQLSFRVLQAYQQIKTIDLLIDDIQKSIHAAQKYVHISRSLYSQSHVLKSDVLLATMNQQSVQAALKIALSEKNSALALFRILIGKSDSDFAPGKTPDITVNYQDVNKLQNEFLASNPQLLAVEHQVNAYEAGIKVAKSNELPKLNLQLRHDWVSHGFENANSSNTALLALSWQLFSSGVQSATDQKAAAQFDTAYAEKNRVIDQLREALVQYTESIQKSLITIQTNQKNIIILREVVRDDEKRYGQGLLVLGQLLDAQSRLDEARRNRDQAQYELIISKAQLLNLIGKQYA